MMDKKRQSDDKDTIVINSINYDGSVCDGPGLRTVLFVQGCLTHCPGCHNPQTWDIKNGFSININDLFYDIVLKSKTKRITISGGEPLLQKEAVKKLMILLRKKDFDIALYTGYERFEIPNDILELLDYVKTGKYIKEKRTTTKLYVGSNNQVFEKVGGEKHGKR